MMDFLENVYDWVNSTIISWGSYGVLFSCFLIVVESMVPILPLTVFIAINFILWKPFLGFIISWIFTVIGCSISYFLCQKFFQKFVNEKLRKNKLIEKLMTKVDKMSLPSLITLLAMPFTPAFAINIAAGVSKMSFKKFLIAILISKTFLVFFWGFIGVGLVESLKNSYYLAIIAIMLVLAYAIGTLVNKKLKIE